MALTKVIGNGLGTLGDGTANDTKIVFDGNAQDFHVGLDDSTDSLTIGLGSTLGTTSHIVIDANGHITKPLQSAFQAKVQTGGQASFAYNAAQTIIFSRETFDQNADFASNTFTAPVTGRYLLSFHGRVDDIDSAASWVRTEIITSNRNYKSSIIDPRAFDADAVYWNFSQTVLADMDAGDTAYIYFGKSGGAAQSDLHGADSFFSGFLAC